MKQSITALYLAKNEAEFLAMSVSTVADSVDKILLVDNASTDMTHWVMQMLVRAYPGKVRVEQFSEDFDQATEAGNRNRALKLVDTDWVLPLDADQLMSDGWRRWVKKPMADPKIDAIRARYEHYVGSYEHIHKTFYEKQKNNELHPEVPLWQNVMFRMRPDLKWYPAMLSDPRFREWHHASPEISMKGRRYYNCGGITCFHFGFSKRNMMELSCYRIHRGDYGHDEEAKAGLTKELLDSGNPFKFIGSVCPVDYGPEAVPSVMRDKFRKTYRLELDKNGFIQKRIHIRSGEEC